VWSGATKKQRGAPTIAGAGQKTEQESRNPCGRRDKAGHAAHKFRKKGLFNGRGCWRVNEIRARGSKIQGVITMRLSPDWKIVGHKVTKGSVASPARTAWAAPHPENNPVGAAQSPMTEFD